ADFAQNGDLGNTTISGDSIASSQIVIASLDQIVTAQQTNDSTRKLFSGLRGVRVRRGNRHHAVPSGASGSSDLRLRGNGDSVIWGNGDEKIWGNGDSTSSSNSNSEILRKDNTMKASTIYSEKDSNADRKTSTI